VRGEVDLAEAALADELAQRVVPHRLEVGRGEFTVAPSASGPAGASRAGAAAGLTRAAACTNWRVAVRRHQPVCTRARSFCIFWQTDLRVAAAARGASQRAGAATPSSTYLLPLGLDLSLRSEVRLHGLRRSVVEKTTSAASSMGAGS
jgi:hypothetical protein